VRRQFVKQGEQIAQPKWFPQEAVWPPRLQPACVWAVVIQNDHWNGREVPVEPGYGAPSIHDLTIEICNDQIRFRRKISRRRRIAWLPVKLLNAKASLLEVASQHPRQDWISAAHDDRLRIEHSLLAVDQG
jgi:hypothetical protein